MRHPAENYIKYMLIRELASLSMLQQLGQVATPSTVANQDNSIKKALEEMGYIAPNSNYIASLRTEIGPPPDPFNPLDKLDRESVGYIRKNKVYDMFYDTEAMREAWNILQDRQHRSMIEQIVLAKCINKSLLARVNKRYGTNFTEDSVRLFEHFFWNHNLLSYEEWGKYLSERSSDYEEYVAMLKASPQLLLFKLRVEQQVESKEMIKRAQQIAHHTLEQVNLQPGVKLSKIQSIGLLTRAITDCDTALAASDAAIATVLKQFERFRMEHPQEPAQDIKQLATTNNYSGVRTEEERKVH